MQVEQHLQHQWLSVCHANDIPYIPSQSDTYHVAGHLQYALADCASILHHIPGLDGSQVGRNQGDTCLQVSPFQKISPIVQALLQDVSQALMILYDDLKLHGECLALALFQEVAIATIDGGYQHTFYEVVASTWQGPLHSFLQAWRMKKCDL